MTPLGRAIGAACNVPRNARRLRGEDVHSCPYCGVDVARADEPCRDECRELLALDEIADRMIDEEEG
jgi:hypothetical protein